MRVEAWVFGVCSIFFVLIAPAYWFITGDPTGTTALVFSAFLVLMVTGYLGFHASRMEPRPEDRVEGEIEEGAGELGFFPPYSWWPLWAASTLALIVFALALQAWWLVIIGAVFGFLALTGWVFEYYVGEHAH